MTPEDNPHTFTIFKKIDKENIGNERPSNFTTPIHDELKQTIVGPSHDVRRYSLRMR